MNLKKKIYVFGAVAVLLAGCGRQETTYLEAVQQEETEEKVTETDMREDVGLCYVYVCGAVKEPGVYSLPAGSHIFEAVEMAGGMTEDAAAEAVNQAELIAEWQGKHQYGDGRDFNDTSGCWTAESREHCFLSGGEWSIFLCGCNKKGIWDKRRCLQPD